MPFSKSPLLRPFWKNSSASWMSSAVPSPRYACAGGPFPAVRLRGQLLDDLRRARLFLVRAERPAGEDAAPARRVRHAADRGRADDRYVAHVRQRGDTVADVDVGQRVLERRDD